MSGAWRVLPLAHAEAEDLLARGLALLDGLATDPTPVAFPYHATAPAIVLGRGQRALALRPDAAGTTTPALRPDVAGHADTSGNAADPPHVVGRFSGGGAVLMDDGLLCLDLVVPAGHPLLDGDLGAVSTRVGEIWRAALHELGVRQLTVHAGPSTAQLRGDPRQRLLAAVCYATRGRGEVLAGDRKLVGLAQRRRRPGALIQCGLLRRWAPAPLLAALGADPDDAQIAGLAVGLDELLTTPPSDDVIISAVLRRLVARWTAAS